MNVRKPPLAAVKDSTISLLKCFLPISVVFGSWNFCKKETIQKKAAFAYLGSHGGGKKPQHSGHILTWKSELILCVSTIYFFNANKINHYLNSYLKIFCSNKPKNNYVTVNLLPKDQRNLTLQAVFPKIPDTVPSIWWKKWKMCYIAKESHHIQNVKYWI